MADKKVYERLLGKLDALATQFSELDHKLTDPRVLADAQQIRDVSVRRAALAPLVEKHRRHSDLRKQISENEGLIRENSEAELVAMARAELPELTAQADALLEEIAGDLVTADDRVIGAVILEVRAGTGGAEAALWAGDLLNMYQRYATRQGWAFDVMELAQGEVGGLRNAIVNVQGQGVWQGLGYEGGVHCVKRVPETEAQGRIHTSTATVAVLAEPEKVQIDIPEADVKVNVTTSQGPGGQNVNKVATAVNLIHIPTGIEVRMQESKSQIQNRAKAWRLLRARVWDHFQRIADAQRANVRSTMIGSGERSQRIRTYRYKESIVVDDRLEQQSFPLAAVLDGKLDELVNGLIREDQTQRLARL